MRFVRWAIDWSVNGARIEVASAGVQPLAGTLVVDFTRYLRRICQGYSLSGDQDTLEMELAATFCSPSIGVGGEELDFPILNRRFED